MSIDLSEGVSVENVEGILTASSGILIFVVCPNNMAVRASPAVTSEKVRLADFIFLLQ